MNKRNFLAIITRPAESVITLILCVFLVVFVELIVMGVLWLYTYQKPAPPKISSEQKHEIGNAGKRFLPDGTLNLVYPTAANINVGLSNNEITDTNGQVLWQGPRNECPFKYLDWSIPPASFSEWQMRNLSSLTPDLSSALEVPVWGDRTVQDVWRYDPENEVFKGYNLETGPLGFLAANGFVNPAGRPMPFGRFKSFASWTDENPSSVLMLWQTARQIYQIDFLNRTAELLFESEHADINSIQWHQWREKKPAESSESAIRYRPLLCCLTADNKYHVILQDPNQTLTFDKPQQWQNNRIEFTATTDNVFVEYTDTNYNPPELHHLKEEYTREYSRTPQPYSIQLYKVASDGQLRLVNRFDWIRPKSGEKSLFSEDRLRVFQNWVRKASPPAFDLLAFLFEDGLNTLAYEKPDLPMTRAYAQLILVWKPDMNLLSYILTSVLLAIALWHGWARRTSWAKLSCWLVIIALFGVAGLLTYLALNFTPIIKCPVCGKKRGLESPNCVRCGSGLPVPKRKPTDLILTG
jgi:hypothetical protein